MSASEQQTLEVDEKPIVEVKTTPEAIKAREAASLIPIGPGGASPQDMAQQVDYARYMALAGAAIPRHLRNNVGACIAVMDMARVWGFSPYHVARLSYVVNDILAYQAQLVLAVIEKFAPLQKRLRFTFEGEGDDRVCIVSGLFKGEAEALEYRSPRRADIKPKNSPLWATDPDQQQIYLSSMRWARRYCNFIMVGIHTKEELEDQFGTPHVGAENAKDVSPLRMSLSGQRGEGFAGADAVRHVVDTALEAASERETEDQSDKPVGRGKASPARKAALREAGTTTTAAPDAAGAENPQSSAPTPFPVATNEGGAAREVSSENSMDGGAGDGQPSASSTSPPAAEP